MRKKKLYNAFDRGYQAGVELGDRLNDFLYSMDDIEDVRDYARYLFVKVVELRQQLDSVNYELSCRESFDISDLLIWQGVLK